MGIKYGRMECKHTLIAAILVSLFLAVESPGQTTAPKPDDSSRQNAKDQWSMGASAWVYVVPDTDTLVNPNFTADRGRLHLEARYNFEARQTGSAWIGSNFSVGDKVVLEVSPMLGGVFGKLNGIAPGYMLSLSFGRFSLTSQAEYVFDLEDRSGNFFYSWSEFSYSPLEWFRAGMAAQRTKIYQTDLDIQRGLLVGFSRKRLDVTAYVLNFGWTDPTVIVAVGVKF